jgi:dienelactone hydrolase
MNFRRVEYKDGGELLVGELYAPSTSNGRAVVVVHEADGIGANVRRRCALLAELGYFALAADLHGGGKVLDGQEMQTAVAAFLADPERLGRRVAAAVNVLSAETGIRTAKMAAIGYCFGGTAVLELARGGSDVAAVVSFHGLLTTRRPAAPGSIHPKVAAFTGAKDPLVPLEQVTAFQAEMAAADADWQLSVYGRAWHSFTNVGVQGSSDPRMRYDPVADTLSWNAALAFLADAFAVRSV